jgi:hypothetical protein
MDPFALCESTFGTIKAAWAQRLQVLASSYSPEQLTAAFAKAKQHKARDLAYVERMLENERKEQMARIEDASAETVTQPASGYERDAARYAGIGHIFVLVDNDGYDGPPAEPVPEDEIRGYTDTMLRWWLAQASCTHQPENERIARDELRIRAEHDVFWARRERVGQWWKEPAS